ncbi:hybrid sensor histidine kinase/response regulator [Burkholderia sp. L27(2015)]|uniref:hybrid sensor histidine kinase/response regulator n=1 Tax=Burkholderia sp. L27(2015) TaxID=1641858 RepID=UPI00131BBD96|nr:hybrid sensor histidine kinase/response regulator [Burkholderia sp. L27(2015)]
MSSENSTKLLIVDDLPENLRALNAIIQQDGRTVYQASSGEAALALLLEHEFALAILDVQMPGMDGFELAELMRGTEKTRHIPIVFVSAAGRELNYAFKGYETGAVDFLYKPLDVGAVKSKVNVFVSLYQQRHETRRQVAALEKSRQEQETLLQELHATQAELQRSVQMRDEFMSMVAHELRTPLNTLFLEAQVRKMQLDRHNLDAFNEDNLNKMVARDGRQIQSMIRLIDDMLDVSRMRSGRLSIRPKQTDLSVLLERIVSDLAHQAGAQGSTIALTAQPHVIGLWDAFRIEQVVANLLNNALRYGQKNPIEVTLTADAHQARIDVRDYGVGISSTDQQRIFNAFERGANNDTPGGLGLGLYITKQLTEAHQGEIVVLSSLGEGALFSVSLPLVATYTDAG